MSEKSCQKKVQDALENFFGKWADLVSRRTTIVFITSLIFFVAIATGMSQSKSYENE